MRVHLLLLPLALAGCISAPVYRYQYGNVTRQQFAADQAACNAQSAVFNTGGLMGAAMFGQQKEMCMEGKGYLVDK